MKSVKKIKVAFCIPDMVIGGVETVFVNTIEELLKYPEFEIKIVSHTNISEPVYAEWLNNLPKVSQYVYYPLYRILEKGHKLFCVFPIKQIYKIFYSLYKKYRRILMWFRSDLRDVDVFIDYKNMFFSKELRYFNKPKIAWFHSSLMYFENYESKKLKDSNQYDTYVGLTDEFVSEIKERYPNFSNKIIRIYNIIKCSEIRKKSVIGAVGTGQYFCHVSRLVPGKDIITVLKAFDLFAKTHKDVSLYIVGDGNKRREFEEFAHNLNASSRIFFVGETQNPYGYIRGSLANILSSEYEGLPTVVLETIALNRICISSDCKNGPREILLNGTAGLLFDIGDFVQLSKHMSDVYNNCIDKEIMQQKMSVSLKRFSAQSIGKQISELIKTAYIGHKSKKYNV